GLYESSEDEENYYMIMSPKVVCDNCPKNEKFEDPRSLMQKCKNIGEGARLPGGPEYDYTGIKAIYGRMMERIPGANAPRLICGQRSMCST
uniref:Uncharacterized protein n=1 Tax=Parascaris univalens TaxID=6257 RepID=A0A915CDR3_PARUN